MSGSPGSGARERRGPAAVLLPALGLLAWVLCGCSQAPPPRVLGAGTTDAEAAEPEAAEPVQDEAPEAAGPEGEAAGADAAADELPAASGDEAETALPPDSGPAGPPGPRTRERDDATVILIERGEPAAPRPTSLYEAAAAARAKRAEEAPARIAVTDENLHEFQSEGVTFMAPEAAPENPAAEGGADAAAGDARARPGGAEAARGEAYWRSRVRDLRVGLRAAVDELTELESRVGSLRRSFYAADDPYVRDGEIKPAWDRVLDRIAETRKTIESLRTELGEALEEGRAAGALPGWLREGLEVEPEEDELPRERERGHEPGQPEILDLREPPPGA